MNKFGGKFGGNPRDNFFIGTQPDDATKEQLEKFYAEFSCRHKLHVRPRLKENYHITLHSIPLQEHLVEPARQACEAISREVSPVSVQFGEVMTFNGSALVLAHNKDSNAELKLLHRLLGTELTKRDFQIEKRFNPHVTLAYGQAVTRQIVQPFGWTVKDLVLIYSFHGQSRYEPLGRWQLTGSVLPPALRDDTNPPAQPELALF